jgi:DnaJ-class molecular chaperone
MANKINERVTCGRCGGLGQWCGGSCFKCNGHGKHLTVQARALRTALAETDERLAKLRAKSNQNALIIKSIQLNEERRRLIFAA